MKEQGAKRRMGKEVERERERCVRLVARLERCDR